MKDLVENLFKTTRIKGARGKLAEALGITYGGLQHKLTYDTFDEDDIPILEEFFDVSKGYFKTKTEAKPEQNMWEALRELYEKRNEELSAALADARYTIKLQRQMLEGKANFLNLSKKPPVKIINNSFMYVSHISPAPVLNIG